MSTRFKMTLLSIAGGMLLIGLVDSIFLFYKYITADPINCFIFDGCNTVANSSYSHIFGIPMPAFGLIYYSVMLSLFGALIVIERPIVRQLFFLGGIVGFLFSVWSVYLQGFVIQAFCVYCLISATAATIIFCSSILLLTAKPVDHTTNPS